MSDKIYVIKMDPQKNKIVPTENERFKDINWNPIKRYKIVVELRKGFTVLKAIRHDSDRITIYTIEAVATTGTFFLLLLFWACLLS